MLANLNESKTAIKYFIWTGAKTEDPQTHEYGYEFKPVVAMMPKNVIDPDKFAEEFRMVNAARELEVAADAIKKAGDALKASTQEALKKYKAEKGHSLKDFDENEDLVKSVVANDADWPAVLKLAEMNRGYYTFAKYMNVTLRKDGTPNISLDAVSPFILIYANIAKTRKKFPMPIETVHQVTNYINAYLDAAPSSAKNEAGRQLKNALADFCNQSLATTSESGIFKNMHVKFKDRMLVDVCRMTGQKYKMGKKQISITDAKPDFLAKQVYLIALRDCFTAAIDDQKTAREQAKGDRWL